MAVRPRRLQSGSARSQAQLRTMSSRMQVLPCPSPSLRALASLCCIFSFFFSLAAAATPSRVTGAVYFTVCLPRSPFANDKARLQDGTTVNGFAGATAEAISFAGKV